jgi:hypothetical protein
MTSSIFRLAAFAVGLLAAAATAKAQIVVRDDDGEARNAYQETCTASQRTAGFASCTQPALPPGKRLAIRYVSATCRESSLTRNPTITTVGRIDSVTSASAGPVLSPRRVNSARPFYLLGEPVFLHTDSPPQVIVTWEGDGTLDCVVQIFGYLVVKK